MSGYYRNFQKLSKNQLRYEVQRVHPIQQVKLARLSHESGKPDRGQSKRGTNHGVKTKLRFDSLAQSPKLNRQSGIQRDIQSKVNRESKREVQRNDAFRFSARNLNSPSGRSANGLNSGRQSRSGSGVLSSSRSQSPSKNNSILAPRSNGKNDLSLRSDPFGSIGKSTSNSNSASRRSRTGGGSILGNLKTNRDESRQRDLAADRRVISGSSIGQQNFSRQRQVQDEARRRQLDQSRNAAALAAQQAKQRVESARRLIDLQRSKSTTRSTPTQKPSISNSFFNQSKNQRWTPQRSASQKTTSPRSSSQRTIPQRTIPQRTIQQRTIQQRATPQKLTPQRSTFQSIVPKRSTSQRSITPRSTSQQSILQRSSLPKLGASRAAPQKSTFQRSRSQPSLQQKTRSSGGRSGRGIGRGRRK